jgi:hypothetical protein
MIVMDCVDGKSVWQLQQDNALIPAIVPVKVEEAVHGKPGQKGVQICFRNPLE